MTIHPTPQNPTPYGSMLFASGALTFLCSVEGVDVWLDLGDSLCPVGLHLRGKTSIDWAVWNRIGGGALIRSPLSAQAVDYIRAALQLMNH